MTGSNQVGRIQIISVALQIPDDFARRFKLAAKVNPPTVIISGMHRSGTSLVASMMAALSVQLGAHLVPADSHNEPGYFEDVKFLRFHQRVLSQLCVPDEPGHSDWGWTESERLDVSRFGEFRDQAQRLLIARTHKTGPWGWKDPRTTLFLDFWDSLLEEARYVFVYRFPWDVADSMQRLEAEVFLRKPEYAYRIWAFYNRRLRDFYLQHSDRCLLVSINALQKNLERFVYLLGNKLGLPTSESQLEELFKDHLFQTIAGQDPLIDLVAAAHPDCARLLAELDELADISGAGLWQARPVRSRLSRPDATDDAPVDVSVVTPCYEQGTLLLEAIASVERDAPPRCELIIVNDGSQQPRTLEILDLLKRCGYFVIDQENAGLSAARNKAISLARGRYILPLDDDNRIREGFLAEAIRVLDLSPEVGIVYGDRYDFGLRTGIEQVSDFDSDKLLEGNYIDACAVFRKQVWTDCQGYDPLMCLLEDWEFWVHAAARGWRFHHIPRVTFDYRVRPGSLISQLRSGATDEGFRKTVRVKHSELYWAKSVKELEEIKRLLAEKTDQQNRLKDERDLSVSQLEVTRAQIAEKDQEIVVKDQEIGEKDQAIAAKDQEIVANALGIWAKVQEIAAKDQEIVAKDQEIAARDQEVAARDQAIAAKDSEIAAKDSEIAARDHEVAARDHEVAARVQEIATRDQEIVARDQEIGARDQEIGARDHEIRVKDQEIRARDQERQVVSIRMALKQQELQTLSLQLADRDARLERMTGSLGWRLLSRYGRFKYRYLLPVYRLFGQIPFEPAGTTRLAGLPPHDATEMAREQCSPPEGYRGEEIDADFELKASDQKLDSLSPLQANGFEQGSPIFYHRPHGDPVSGITEEVIQGFTELSELIIKNPERRLFSKPDNLTLITYNNYKHRVLIERCYQAYGIYDYVVLGKEIAQWDWSTKIRTVLDYLESGICFSDYIVATDSDDVLMVNNPASIIDLFESYSCDVLFCNTFVDYPPNKYYQEFETQKYYTHPFHSHLSAGGYIGRRDALIEFLREITSACKEKSEWAMEGEVFNDQLAWRHLHYKYYPRIKVDFKSLIFKRYDLFMSSD